MCTYKNTDQTLILIDHIFKINISLYSCYDDTNDTQRWQPEKDLIPYPTMLQRAVAGMTTGVGHDLVREVPAL